MLSSKLIPHEISSNFTVKDAYVRGGSFTGGIIGHCQLKGAVVNLEYNGVVLSSGTVCGGIVGYMTTGFGNIENCRMYGSVTTTHEGVTTSSTMSYGVGGIVGYSYATKFAIKNCKNYATISQNCDEPLEILAMGGICGRADEVTRIEGCENYGDVSGIRYTGGICGFHTYMTVYRNCSNDGNITGTSYVGGIVGNATKAGNMFSGCANRGNITGSGSRIAGICASNGASSSGIAIFENCYNAGILTSAYDSTSPYIAGISAADKADQSFMNCYNYGKIITKFETANCCGAITLNNVECIVSNCYALAGSCTNLTGAASKSAEWFASDEAISALGSSYVKGENGYPILAWQV